MPGFPLVRGLGKYVLNPKPSPETTPPPHANRNPTNRGGRGAGGREGLSRNTPMYRPDKVGKHFGSESHHTCFEKLRCKINQKNITVWKNVLWNGTIKAVSFRVQLGRCNLLESLFAWKSVRKGPGTQSSGILQGRNVKESPREHFLQQGENRNGRFLAKPRT